MVNFGKEVVKTPSIGEGRGQTGGKYGKMEVRRFM